MDYFALFCLVSGFCVGFGAAFVWMWQVKRQALSIANTKAGELGRTARKEQEGELMALITEAGLEFKAAKEAGEDIKDTAARVVPQLMRKYPTVVMKHGKKLLKMVSEGSGMEGLEELF